MSERERMLAGKVFNSRGDEELNQLSHDNRSLMQEYNRSKREEYDLRAKLMREMFGSVGANVTVEQPVYIEYGAHIHIGDNFYANMDCMFVDVGEIKIGNQVQFGPRVSLLTGSHPLGAKARKTGLEYALPITIEDDVLIGANTTVLPGVTIGAGSIISAGSVVTRDIPAGYVAAGNPCQLVRKLTDEDSTYWNGQVQDYYYEKEN